MNIKEIQLAQVKALLAHFAQGNIPVPVQHEIKPDLDKSSRQNYLYFTLPVCLNFQRSSPAMWASAYATYEDSETNYVFFPELLLNQPIEKVRADLMKHNLALQPNKHVLIWTTIAHTLHEFYANDPRNILKEAEYDAELLIHNLQIKYKKRFPYLSGPKLSNYWPFILSHFTDVRFKNSHSISIIPDTHVIQASVHLGLVSPGASPLLVEQVWRELLTGSGINPATVHPVLWNWSRNKFSPRVN